MIYALILLAFAHAFAQDPSAVEGRVTSSTTHTPIAGVTVSAGAQHAITDASGNFRLTGLSAGERTLTFEADGFFKLETARLDVALTPHSSIAGRVLDEQGNPAAGVRVEITQAIRGTGTTWYQWRTITDKEGRYRKEDLQPGTYLAMAKPEPAATLRDGERRAAVRTYYPGVSARGEAGRLVLRGGTHLAADIRLVTTPVYAIRGVIYDDGGQPVTGAVSLVPAEAMEEPEAHAEARDGVFEFRDVPPGDWRVLAEALRGAARLKGVAPVLLGRHDVENVTVRLAAPFELSGAVEPPESGKEPAVELYPADAPPGLAVFARAKSDGTLRFPAIYPGRYRVNVFGTIPDHYLDSVRLGEQDVLGQDILFAEGMPALRVVYKPNAAALRGKVENGGGASILLLPQNEALWNERFIRRASCDGSGHFEIDGLRPGDYYALAVDRIDPTGLDDLATLRRLAGISLLVQIDSGRVGYVELKVSAWPE